MKIMVHIYNVTHLSMCYHTRIFFVYLKAETQLHYFFVSYINLPYSNAYRFREGIF